ncbi:hypothetical protein BCR44DRAFT_1488546 [Catenaria anguillulae PL171]|uniref:Uncharacterized protein n=1 Tax=Catenaria anguillulae PL171 TaxID=765915 RepID=A0A1Y2HBS9_9FUNG|nr:hypothetical protein BCR44DRAFT_1488546 [Catenaria anguillulae PL171]
MSRKTYQTNALVLLKPFLMSIQQFENHGSQRTLESSRRVRVNKVLQDDKFMRPFKSKTQQQNHNEAASGVKPLDSMHNIKFRPGTHLTRPVTALAVDEPPLRDPADSTAAFLFDVADAKNPISQITPAMDKYIAIVIRPRSGECYSTHEQVQLPATLDGLPAVFKTQERTSWQYGHQCTCDSTNAKPSWQNPRLTRLKKWFTTFFLSFPTIFANIGQCKPNSTSLLLLLTISLSVLPNWKSALSCLGNVNLKSLLLPPKKKGHSDSVPNQQHIESIRRDNPLRRFELLAAFTGASSADVFETSCGLTADATFAYWHRIVVDHWTEVPSVHSLLAARSWIALDSQRYMDSGKKARYGHAGVFLEQAHRLAVNATIPTAPTVLEVSLQHVFPSPLELALSTIVDALTDRTNPWVLVRKKLQAMRKAETHDGYPYLPSSLYAKWQLVEVVNIINKWTRQFQQELQAALPLALSAIQRLFSVAKGHKAIEIALLVLDRDLRRQSVDNQSWIKEALEYMSSHAPKVIRNRHIDLEHYKLVVSKDEHHMYRPKTYNDDGEGLHLDERRDLDGAIRAVCQAVELVAKARTNWDVCLSTLQLARNTADGVSCKGCLPDLPENGPLDLRFEFNPASNIKRSRDWCKKLVTIATAGSDNRIWPSAFIQTLVLQAVQVISAGGDQSEEPDSAALQLKRIAIFLTADHIKTVSSWLKLLNVPYVIVDNKSMYAPLKALYNARSSAPAKHVPIVLVDSALPRMARLRIPAVSHVFLASGWRRSDDPSSFIATALRPPNEEQSAIHVTSFTVDSCCESVPLVADEIKLPSRTQE